jgi:hypothetical protein
MNAKAPKKSKFKFQHFRLEKKGLKGFKINENCLAIKFEKFILITQTLWASRRI